MWPPSTGVGRLAPGRGGPCTRPDQAVAVSIRAHAWWVVAARAAAGRVLISADTEALGQGFGERPQAVKQWVSF